MITLYLADFAIGLFVGTLAQSKLQVRRNGNFFFK